MIVRANINMLSHLKHIWQTCFDDTIQGTDFVFSHLLSAQQMLAYIEDGIPVAMLNWKLLTFTACGNSVKGAYIFGVATLPQYRGRGISRKMMCALHDILQAEDVKLSCLIPANTSLFNFYKTQGFETFFSYKLIKIESKEIDGNLQDVKLVSTSLKNLERLRNQAFDDSCLFGAWDKDYLQFAGEENAFYGGETLEFSVEKRRGYVVCIMKEDGCLLVREAAVNKADIPELLAALHRHFKAKNYHLRLPMDFADEIKGIETPFAMIRWYDETVGKPACGKPKGAPWFAFGLDL